MPPLDRRHLLEQSAAAGLAVVCGLLRGPLASAQENGPPVKGESGRGTATKAGAEKPASVATVPELKLLGVLATAGLQNAWLLLDVTSSAWKEQGLTASRAKGIATALGQQLTQVSRGLDSIDPERLVEADQLFVEEARQCGRRLQLAARALVRWIDRPSLSESRSFDRALRSAAEAVEELSAASTPMESSSGDE